MTDLSAEALCEGGGQMTELFADNLAFVVSRFPFGVLPLAFIVSRFAFVVLSVTANKYKKLTNQCLPVPRCQLPIRRLWSVVFPGVRIDF